MHVSNDSPGLGCLYTSSVIILISDYILSSTCNILEAIEYTKSEALIDLAANDIRIFMVAMPQSAQAILIRLEIQEVY